MSGDPCADLKQTMVKASQEAAAAHSAKARWAVPEKVERIADIVPSMSGDIDEIRAVFELSRESEEKSMKALIAWIECMNQNR